MPQPNAQNATVTAAEFLTRCFAPGETIALFLRREVPRATIQRIVQLETALAPRYLAWLAHENSAGANVYVAANPLRSDSRKRTKECIAAVRHLYLDLDTDGETRLSSERLHDSTTHKENTMPLLEINLSRYVSAFCSTGRVHCRTGRSICRFRPRIRRRCCGQGAQLCLLEGQRLSGLSEDTSGRAG